MLTYAELLREHFFWSTCEQFKRKATDRQLLSLHSTAARKYDSRFKTQAKFQAKSSLHHVKFLGQRAATVCCRAKNPGEAAHPPPAPKRRRGKGKAKRDDGVAPQHFKLTDAGRDLFVDYLRERPFMYEKKDKDYKDAPRRKREWEACANLVGRTVELLQGWLKSRRSMLDKARSIKSKSGPDSEPLPPSLQWVYDNLSFMSAGAGVLHSETLGPRRGVPGSPFADEADLEEPGPSKRPRHAAPSSSASGAHSSTPLEGPACSC